MLHHVSIGVRDVEHAAEFYDAVLGALGYKRVVEFLPYAVAYGDDAPEFWVTLPHNKQVATAGNGVHVSFIARTKDAVDTFHAKAVELGAQDAGAPGPRADYSPDYYGAFVFDIDGNKLEATLVPLPAAAKKVRKTVKKAKKATPAKKSVAAKKSAPVKKAAKKAAKKVAKKAVKKVKAAPAKKAAKKVAKKKVARKSKKK